MKRKIELTIAAALTIVAAMLPGRVFAAVPTAPASLPAQYIRIDQAGWTYNMGACFTDNSPEDALWFGQAGGPQWLAMDWSNGVVSVSGMITEGRWTVTAGSKSKNNPIV